MSDEFTDRSDDVAPAPQCDDLARFRSGDLQGWIAEPRGARLRVSPVRVKPDNRAPGGFCLRERGAPQYSPLLSKWRRTRQALYGYHDQPNSCGRAFCASNFRPGVEFWQHLEQPAEAIRLALVGASVIGVPKCLRKSATRHQ